MSERSPDPSIEELLARIVQLEAQISRLLKQQDNINALKAELADLGAAFRTTTRSTTVEIEHIHQYIGDIHDFLWPLVHKVFPGYAVAKHQSDAILKDGKSRPDDKESR